MIFELLTSSAFSCSAVNVTKCPWPVLVAFHDLAFVDLLGGLWDRAGAAQCG